MSNWLDNIINSYTESEAPERFWYWAGIAAMSAVVKKNIWMERWYYKLYPNVYVFIVARSGMKKGNPITLAKSLVTKANCTRVISGRNSMAHIIKDLGKAYTLEGKGMVKNAQALIVSGELAAFLVKDPDALTILTDLFDTNAHELKWTNSLKGTGVDVLDQPCITILGATNEDHFPETVGQADIKGGFIARTFIIYSNEPANINSLMKKPTQIPDVDSLAIYLKDLSSVKGQVRITGEAELLYDNWYNDMMSRLQKGDTKDPTGTFGRLGDQVLKLAMLISLAENFSLEIKKKHVFEAIAEANVCVQGMKQVTMGTGTSSTRLQTRMVIKALLQSPDHKLTRKKMLANLWGDLNHYDLDIAVETLLGAGWVKVTGAVSNIQYELQDNALELYTSFKRGVQ